MNKSEDKDITETIHFIVGFYLGTAQENEYCYEDEKPKLDDVEKVIQGCFPQLTSDDIRKRILGYKSTFFRNAKRP